MSPFFTLIFLSRRDILKIAPNIKLIALVVLFASQALLILLNYLNSTSQLVRFLVFENGQVGGLLEKIIYV